MSFGDRSLALLRLAQVMAKRGSKSHTSVYNDVRDELLTAPVKIGERAVAWPEYEINALNAYRIAGRSNAEIRGLVRHLHAQRASLGAEQERGSL